MRLTIFLFFAASASACEGDDDMRNREDTARTTLLTDWSMQGVAAPQDVLNSTRPIEEEEEEEITLKAWL
jgi:hypothetical protein